MLNVKWKMFPHFGKILPNMFPDMPDDVRRRLRCQAWSGTLICYQVQYAGTRVPRYTFCHFSFCLVCAFIHVCNSRGAMCIWLALPSLEHSVSVSCIMPRLPPDYNPKEHALELGGGGCEAEGGEASAAQEAEPRRRLLRHHQQGTLVLCTPRVRFASFSPCISFSSSPLCS